jgi:hypothetical protein
MVFLFSPAANEHLLIQCVVSNLIPHIQESIFTTCQEYDAADQNYPPHIPCLPEGWKKRIAGCVDRVFITFDNVVITLTQILCLPDTLSSVAHRHS